MKYNVGDKVVFRSQLTMLFDPYWKKEKRQDLIKIVTEANKDFFTIYNIKEGYETTLEKALSCDTNKYLAYRQDTGICYSPTMGEQLLHLNADKANIRKIIEKTGMDSFQYDIKSYESQIKNLDDKLVQIKQTYAEDLKINQELLGL